MSTPVTNTDGATLSQAIAVTCEGCKRCLGTEESAVRIGGEVYCVACGEHPDMLSWLHAQGRNIYWETECRNCGRLVRSTKLNAAYCSPQCGQQCRRNQSRYMVCGVCQQSFDQSRADATFCSVACKQRAYRKRKKGESVPPTVPFFGEGATLFLDTPTVIRVYARENATQRGNSGTALAGSIASAVRFLAKGILTDNLAGIPARSERSRDTIKGQLASDVGLGWDVITEFLDGVPGIKKNTVIQQLANLKSSGEYANIIVETEC